MNSRMARIVAAGLVMIASLPAQGPAAEPGAAIEISVGEGTVLDVQGEITRAYTSNPDTVDVVAVDNAQVLINGKLPGRATVIVWTKSGLRRLIPVRVTWDLEPAKKLIAASFPNDAVTVSGTKEALVVTGRAGSQDAVDRMIATLKPLAQSIVSNVEIVPAHGVRQIGLRIVFAELDRTRSEAFGVNLLSTGSANTPGRTSTGQFSGVNPGQVKGTIGSGLNGTQSTFDLTDALNIFAFRPDLNLGATIKALVNRGVLQILAQPNLVASDGKEARFIVGGEFPVPVAQAGSTPGAITVQYREFGIRLMFLPRITPNGTIQMHLVPEVSTLDAANGVILSGFNIPALSTRRIETDVELKPNESFVIAGLLDDRVTQNLSHIPGLASIPILGQLFRSHQISKSKTELVVIVTPEIRFPLEENSVPSIPQMPEKFLAPLASETASKP